jgi:hypothetical protein
MNRFCVALILMTVPQFASNQAWGQSTELKPSAKLADVFRIPKHPSTSTFDEIKKSFGDPVEHVDEERPSPIGYLYYGTFLYHLEDESGTEEPSKVQFNLLFPETWRITSANRRQFSFVLHLSVQFTLNVPKNIDCKTAAQLVAKKLRISEQDVSQKLESLSQVQIATAFEGEEATQVSKIYEWTNESIKKRKRLAVGTKDGWKVELEAPLEGLAEEPSEERVAVGVRLTPVNDE